MIRVNGILENQTDLGPTHRSDCPRRRIPSRVSLAALAIPVSLLACGDEGVGDAQSR